MSSLISMFLSISIALCTMQPLPIEFEFIYFTGGRKQRRNCDKRPDASQTSHRQYLPALLSGRRLGICHSRLEFSRSLGCKRAAVRDGPDLADDQPKI